MCTAAPYKVYGAECYTVYVALRESTVHIAEVDSTAILIVQVDGSIVYLAQV